MIAAAKTQSGTDAVELVRLLEKQQGLFHRLHMLAERQRTLVLAEDHQPLLDLLAERQELVDALVDLTALLAPFRAQWSTLYSAMDESMRRTVTLLLEEVNGALGLILQRDQQDTTMLQARRDSSAQQLATIESKTRVCTAYAGRATRQEPASMETEA